MLFDSPRVRSLVARFATHADPYVPEIVAYVRNPAWQIEREYLEDLALALPTAVQDEYMARFATTERFLPDWFELQLFGWLRGLGATSPQPSVEGCDPDYLVEVGGTRIAVEAWTHLEDEDEVRRQNRVGELFQTLKALQHPYSITFRRCVFGKPLRPSNMRDRFEAFLATSPCPGLYWYLEDDNELPFHLERHSHTAVSVAWFPGGARVVSVAGALRKGLKRKARQHAGIRRAEMPYVLAVYLESLSYGHEELVEAWFGTRTYRYNADSGELVDTPLDGSGLHYARRAISHTTVSGTLLFRPAFDRGRRILRSWYVENPYASSAIRVDPEVFPAEARFVVIARSATEFTMDWTAG